MTLTDDALPIVGQMDTLDKKNELFDAVIEAAETEQYADSNYLGAYYLRPSGEIKTKDFESIQQANIYFQQRKVAREDRLIWDLQTPREHILVS